MKRILYAGIALLFLLAGCSEPAPDHLPAKSFTHGIYELIFSVEQLSGEPTDAWDFVYTYDGETIISGHQIRLSLGIFTFRSIQVDVIEKAAPDNIYSAAFSVAICSGGSGKAELTVTGTDGKTAALRISCRVIQIGKE